MELTVKRVKEALAKKNNDGNAETLKGEVVFQTREALKSIVASVERGDGVTRSNTKWRRCEYIIISLEEPGASIPIETCLEGWKSLAGGHADQILVLQTGDQEWQIYNHNADLIGGNKEFESLIDRILKKKGRAAAPEEYEPYISLLEQTYNLVLTGAPGTGKTFLAKKIAENMNAETCFVQFHPSYDYTDFVEGLRPREDEKGDVGGFIRTNGVFKDFCEKAAKAQNPRFEDLYQEIVDRIKDGTYTTYPYKNNGKKERKLSYKELNGVDQIVFRAELKQPRMEGLENPKLMFEQLLKDGVEDVSSFKTDDFHNLVKRATKGATKTVDAGEYSWLMQKLLELYKKKNVPFVFIIDEINRGEISKIFGELFYSIDQGYRGKKGRVKTQYQNLVKKKDIFAEGFYVPENVYIVGTMNDIDRSVESMDFAMRRRFAWKEISAKDSQSMLFSEEAWDGHMPSESILSEIKIRMNNLNDAIIDQYGESNNLSQKDKIGLSAAYQIGAAYFLKYGLYKDFEKLWDNHIRGLLYEYLRGSNNVDEKIERLHSAYKDTTAH